jgi:hypothetical protein
VPVRPFDGEEKVALHPARPATLLSPESPSPMPGLMGVKMSQRRPPRSGIAAGRPAKSTGLLVGPFMEFKGNTSLPVHCDSSSLKSVGGIVRCPTGPGFGVEIDPDFVAKATPVSV